MGTPAVYSRVRTSTSHPVHRVSHYLLRDLDIERPNQVWAPDVYYLPMASGFLHLVAVRD